MIVNPTNDVVLDVLDAADPVAQRQATAKLDALKPSEVDFAATMKAEAGKAEANKADATNFEPPTRIIKAPTAGESYRKFEAYVLQVFVETMLPQNDDLFGKGTAGGVWRSMLAEQLGNQLARGKGIGIAKSLAASRAQAAAAPDKAG